MDVDLNLFRTRGRAKREVTVATVRELTPADLELLGSERGVKPEPLKRLGERHHMLARYLAGGTPHGVAGAIVGMCGSRVSVLLGDPTFKELVEFYRENVDAQFAQVHEMLAGLSLDATLELRRRFEEEPETLTVPQINEIIKTTADRSGNGPASSQNVNVNIGLADRLQEARKRAAARVIEHREDD